MSEVHTQLQTLSPTVRVLLGLLEDVRHRFRAVATARGDRRTGSPSGRLSTRSVTDAMPALESRPGGSR